MPVSVLEVVRTKVVTVVARAMVVGSVRWRATPVSPVMPLSVRVTVLPVGGRMVTAEGVEPPVGNRDGVGARGEGLQLYTARGGCVGGCGDSFGASHVTCVGDGLAAGS
jgi:hypothetical protein